MKILPRLLPLLALLAFSFAAYAEPGPNLDKEGLALQGHDPVAFFTDGKPVMGRDEFESKHRGATYRFASAEHKALFEKDPAKYEPQFGGYCAYGVAKGSLSPVKLEAFQIVDGRLLMQYNSEVRDAFNKDTRGQLEKADKNWPELKAKER